MRCLPSISPFIYFHVVFGWREVSQTQTKIYFLINSMQCVCKVAVRLDYDSVIEFKNNVLDFLFIITQYYYYYLYAQIKLARTNNNFERN